MRHSAENGRKPDSSDHQKRREGENVANVQASLARAGFLFVKLHMIANARRHWASLLSSPAAMDCPPKAEEGKAFCA